MRNLFYSILIFFITPYIAIGNGQSGSNILLFTIHQCRDVYEQSDYGEPPQCAIWLENKKTGEVQTVFVTYRTATGDFEGKVECPVSLPAWIGVFRKETSSADIPSVRYPAHDAVTGATPKEEEFKVKTTIPEGTQWNYYVEVNVSADYTPDFPSVKADGTIDSQGNGQPSIIYKGEITGLPGEQSSPLLIGRTEQFSLSTKINPSLKGIGNAQNVFSRIQVVCIRRKNYENSKEP